ncbi:hypothetical protein AA0229_1909 [Gluconobacter cerinus NRIC 0229]|nr:hypothetical protein AA0229_1909 [Gluconobacter cerinus NRIC 0229]
MIVMTGTPARRRACAMRTSSGPGIAQMAISGLLLRIAMKRRVIITGACRNLQNNPNAERYVLNVRTFAGA